MQVGDVLDEVLREVLLLVGTLFPIVNPLGGAPIFLSLTRGVPTATRAMLARKIAINGLILLLVSIFIGTHILAFFGISLPVVQVGGGMVVITTGWSLLNSSGESGSTHHHITPGEASKRVFYPLTLPLTVGPGSISAAITIGANRSQGHAINVPTLLGACGGAAIIALSVYLSYRFAERIARALGEAAMNVILRLTSFILVCIGVQIFWNGATALVRTTFAGRPVPF